MGLPSSSNMGMLTLSALLYYTGFWVATPLFAILVLATIFETIFPVKSVARFLYSIQKWYYDLSFKIKFTGDCTPVFRLHAALLVIHACNFIVTMRELLYTLPVLKLTATKTDYLMKKWRCERDAAYAW